MIRGRAPPAGRDINPRSPLESPTTQENTMSHTTVTIVPAAPQVIQPDAVLKAHSTELVLGSDHPDLGASTAEYAVIVLAAAAFGGVMAAVLSSDSVSGLLLGIIQKALSV
ncbi:MAG: DUF4244 domain-containing protein [Kocuria rhizophila]|nr:MAG: DUF4244 domain-containing protein [Kocuria rhizophila]